MLTSLSIRNIVLIESLVLEPALGLNVLTGETGAGKSILLDSLGLALGARADAGLLRKGAEKGVVIAEFDVAEDHPARALIAEADIEADGPILVRRQIKADGASRAFCNDAPISARLLRSIGDTLVEVHGQHDERGLLDSKGHLALLDAFGGHDVAGLAQAHAKMIKAEAALEARIQALADMRAEEAYLTQSADEIEAMAPEPGEEAKLADERAAMQRGIRMLDSLREAYESATGDKGPDALIRLLIRTLSRLPDATDEQLGEVLDALDRAAVETDNAVKSLAALISASDVDPADLDRTEQRLFDLRALGRKHDCAVDALPALALHMREQLAALADAEQDMASQEEAAQKARAAFEAAAQTMRRKRKAAAKALDAAVNAELPALRLDAARFRTALVEQEAQRWSATGAETCHFEVSTNPGADFGPIIKIASGGELARFILALKVALASAGGAQTMIFDEVDRGVGGPTAAAVGRRLARLSDDGQVIVVTHSPQVAAMGERHWKIEKSEDSGTVVTDVRPLAPDARMEEIARMLSGDSITPQARAAAQSLLSGG